MIGDNQIIAFLACAYDKNVMDEINKKFEFRVTEMSEGRKYLTSEEFLSKEVTLDNFDKCVEYVLKMAKNEDIRDEFHERRICYIMFYNKYDDHGNLLTKNPALIKLNNKIVKKELIGDKLNIYIHPIKKWKEEILFAKTEIIDFFTKNGKTVNEVEVIYTDSGEVLDEASACFIDLGFSIVK